ncbi:sensor histidine kinase [Rhodopirellula sp. P2]|uniref:sensor histidine kinase n=1 Tax=Rhodopirellula sp. P2 TaxID=2127060 RepID=UPI002367D5C6|nr:ATP-binding protein [Rhodopirellula sp. P2]WDQ15795.1 ATP-binding protein [Rhodopirellula sp. P2]
MSLTNRVCVFFLAALGIILAGYSLVFYSITSEHVRSRFDDELGGVLKSLIAAAEVEETEVKWQPLEHSIDFGVHDEFGAVHWVVIGDDGVIVERSRAIDQEFMSRVAGLTAFTSIPLGPYVETDVAAETTLSDGWAMMSRQVSAPRPVRLLRELDEFDQLKVVVGRSTAPRDAILFRLMLLVTLLPLLAWSIAALLGQWMVRKALRPVAAMAEQAQAISGTDFDSRLTHTHSGDELAELATAFNRLLGRQQEAFDQQRRFAGEAAHELRTPLTVLRGEIDVTLRRPRSESEYQSTLSTLRNKTHTLQEIVESLLFLARNDRDSSTPTLRCFELPCWLESQRTTWPVEARRDDVQLEIALPEHASVRATPALLARVVDNLVGNAVKYSQPGTPIVVRALQENDETLIQVVDSGAGIRADEVPKLFDPFFRSSDARRRGIAGTGLGLAIASRIATTLGGKLECVSTPGSGSCFTLRLPKSQPASSEKSGLMN